MAFLGIDSAGERVDKWIMTHPAFPGCNVNSLDATGCSFNGTAADWQEYRRNWIQNCGSDNSGGFMQSKNKTLTKCQSVFDANTTTIAFQQYAANAGELNYIKTLLGGDNTMIYLGVFLFAGIVIYLLMSK